MNFVARVSSVLNFAAGYRLFGSLVRGKAWDIYLSEYVRPARGEKILDIGCGPADIVDRFSDVDYVGFDINPDYIASANRRFSGRGRFYCSDVGLTQIGKEQGTFSLALATGVVHHLTDEEAIKLFELAHSALKPGGRLITFDGCYLPGQSRVARWMLDHDRGKFVRDQAGYSRLASQCFPKVDGFLRQDLLRVPYTHFIMRCSR